jgi:hypothetical protein
MWRKPSKFRMIARTRRREVELEGVVHKGVIVPDDATGLPEGARVRISPVPPPPAPETPKPFGERFAQFKGAASGLPADLAARHGQYRLGTPKR